MEGSYTDAIKAEMLKGRSFDEILNEDPPDDCSSDELYAWLDAGEIAGLHKNIPDNFRITKRKVFFLEKSLIVLILAMISSPFLIQDKIYLLFNIPIGIVVAIIGRKNSELYSTIEMKLNMNELQKHLSVKGYTQRVRFKEFIQEIIITPLNLICLLCELIFPPINIKK
jgi:hypothetical protein